MRIVFMGTSEFSIPALERLASSGNELVAVYTQPDRPAGRGRVLSTPPAKRVALDQGLDVRQPASLKDANVIDSLAGLRADVIVVAAYGKLLPEPVLTTAPFGCVNVHPSLLPRHRGPSPVATAIMNGDDCTGVTIMLLDSGVDSGPILAQMKTPIEPTDTGGSLTARLACCGANLLMETLPGWFSSSIPPQPQDESAATYTRVLSKSDGEIDWRLTALALWRRVRGLHPWPGCHTTWRGKVLKIMEARCMPGAAAEPGEVVPLQAGGVGVQTGDSILQLLRVQLEGKKEMRIDEFIRGQHSFVGAHLPS
ncbi:MAG: methionyl-tRNA formyltransferase [Chloroflexota bacterium]|nr:methionyl-tRNA formyltransferase [Chloroflexota bacterium]